MPISTHGSPAAHRGFTLLEVMVVVTLIALFATFAVPALVRQSDSLEDSSRRLAATLRVMHEQSLFRSELLALRLSAKGYTPLRFDPAESTFVEMTSDRIEAVELDDELLLEWELDEIEDRKSLARAAEERLEAMAETDEPTTEATNGENGQEEAAKESGFPQVFFFPSGETSPVRFWLRNDDEQSRTLKLSDLGRVQSGEPES